MRSVSTVENFNKFDKDFFCIQGEIDKVVNGFKVFQLERGARGRIKDVVVVEGLWHSLWFDQGADEVIEGVRDWILERIEVKKQKQGEENT